MTRPGVSVKTASILALGLVSASLGVYAAVSIPGKPELISRTKTDWSLLDLRFGEKRPFSSEITNNDSRPMKVRGVSGACGVGGCVNVLDSPTMIPPGESRPFRFEFITRQAGAFHVTAKIFLESVDKKGILVPVTVKGTAVATTGR